MKKQLLLLILALFGTVSFTYCQITCGNSFTDPAGASSNYANNSNYIVTIAPTNPGDKVTVTFTSFNTEASFDALYVFNGNSITSPQIASTNTAAYVPGGLAGGYWGTNIPGPFTSTSADGSLTFRFRSDGSGNNPGWTADVTCAPPPSCLIPTNLALNSITTSSATVGWTDNSAVTSWEVLVVPFGAATPSGSTAGQVVTTNSAIISGLTSGTRYSFYVRAICSDIDKSQWSLKADATTLISNDECSNALTVTVSGNNCTQTFGSITGATASAEPLSTCIGVADDDAWFTFNATDPTLLLSFVNVIGTTSNLNFSIYSGTCNSLTPFYCSTANSLIALLNNLTVGTSYYVRVYSNGDTPQEVTFGVCIKVPSTCANSETVCFLNTVYSNSTGIPSLGTIGCLTTTPNATYFKFKIGSTGPVNLSLSQYSGAVSIPNLDVDYAAWGPFASPSDACTAISSGQAPGIGVPVTLTTGCSYSANNVELLNIANAQAGEYYIILITNFSNQPGFISVYQTNQSPGAGSIDCSTGIMLKAFIDNNTNGTQENGEPNFPLGQFHYEINNNGSSHAVTAPSGYYSLYDYNQSNLYNLSYSINTDYAAQYTNPSSFSNVNVFSGSMTTYNFPVTILQNYTDLGVTITPLSSPRAGTTYNVKIVYTNYGSQTLASGILTYNNDTGTSITNISQTGTTAISNGFTYAFTNLLPYESRSIIVSISVPSIPNVYLGQLLTNTVSIIPPTGDIVANNNSNSVTQVVVASYDPNDKVEGHGNKILFSSFTSNDYLEYTIRFENNGTASALNVMINDILDAKLAENTLVMLASSHNYTLDRLGSILTWKFNNIQLPVAIPDTNIGKGFIKFKIKPKPGFAVGDIIPNTASIYFDSNPPIVTNTFNTEFVAQLNTTTFGDNDIVLYPNPASSSVQISLQNSNESLDNIRIYDVLGKTIRTLTSITNNQVTMDVSNLAKGIYLVEITSASHLKLIKKFVIQ